MLCWPWWLLNVLLTLVVFGYSVNSGYWTFVTSINKKPVKNKTLRQNSWLKFSHWNFAFICNNIPAAFALEYTYLADAVCRGWWILSGFPW
jgi:hypothetical protein